MSVFGRSASCMKSGSSAARCAAVLRSSPYILPAKFRYSAPVSRSNSAMPSGTTPIWRFTSMGCSSRSSPSRRMRPALGASRPVSILIVVDLPAPFGPRKPKNCPLSTVRSIWLTATSSPKRRVSFSVTMAGWVMVCLAPGICSEAPGEFSTPARALPSVNSCGSSGRCGRRWSAEKKLGGFHHHRGARIHSETFFRSGVAEREKSGDRRERNAEAGAAFRPVETGDLPAVLLDQSVANAQTEPGALAHRLGGVKRIEHQLRLLYAGARIAELDHYIRALAHRANGQHAAAHFFHRIHGVADDVEENLQQLIGVAANAGQDGFGLQFDPDVFAAEIQPA